jgi:hypothetical protein
LQTVQNLRCSSFAAAFRKERSRRSLHSPYCCTFFSPSFSMRISKNSSLQGSHLYCNFFSGVFRMGRIRS